MTTTTCLIPLPPSAAATTPAEMDPMLVNSLDPVDLVGPRVSQTPVPSASSVALPTSAWRAHRRPRTPDMTSASTTNASWSQPGKVK
ncbi:hypothetical protein DVH24_032736 [Malus domestica]|uniref:Uncharacterized protein n=1 Tax=Malus domestica TaxID=3750 RepID=A0A498INT8_MALDO|nr:hypothetical protein DVH24_040167 [Malus domestica]RXI09575.1 hypothetical protein DVH24_032736 [Malus domestica]